MTDDERQKLCAALRNKSDDWLPERLRTDVRDEAADEIERLAKELEYTRMACERLREDRDEAAQEIERLAALAQSDAELPPLRYSNMVEKAADGTETRHLERAQSNAEPSHANVEMARAISYAKGFQDGLKAARKALANELNPPPSLTQPDAEWDRMGK